MAAGTAHNRFQKGVTRLTQLYDFSMHCYAEVVDALNERLKSGELIPESHIRSRHGFLPHHRVANTLEYAKDHYPKQLRSVLLVRLVSEFEVFLLDQILEAATRAKVTFRHDARVDWPRGKLLSFDSIEELEGHFRQGDCRGLSSGGLDEIRKYYQKNLAFDVCPPNVKVDEIREIHARRHLHVHNLGTVDFEYKREFNSKLEIGSRLNVSDEYLKNAVALLRLSASHIATAADKHFPMQRPVRLYGSDAALAKGCIAYLTRARFVDEKAVADYFALERTLDTTSTPMKSILLGGERTGTMCEWTIIGDSESLKAFFVDLHKHQQRGVLKLVQQKRLSPKEGD